MTDQSNTPGEDHRFGLDWPSDADAFRAVRKYLQGEDGHARCACRLCIEETASGVLAALGTAGYLSIQEETE